MVDLDGQISYGWSDLCCPHDKRSEERCDELCAKKCTPFNLSTSYAICVLCSNNRSL